MRICVVGASGKLGQYMVRQLLEAGDEVAAVCRPESVKKLDEFAGRIEIFPGKTNDRAVLRRALQGCDGAVVVLVPGVSSSMPLVRRRRCWIMLSPPRAWYFPVAGTSPWMVATATPSTSRCC